LTLICAITGEVIADELKENMEKTTVKKFMQSQNIAGNV